MTRCSSCSTASSPPRSAARASLSLGPGAVLGERAILEAGRRTATLRALTSCKVAVARDVELDPEVLAQLREGHRREDQAR